MSDLEQVFSPGRNNGKILGEAGVKEDRTGQLKGRAGEKRGGNEKTARIDSRR